MPVTEAVPQPPKSPPDPHQSLPTPAHFAFGGGCPAGAPLQGLWKQNTARWGAGPSVSVGPSACHGHTCPTPSQISPASPAPANTHFLLSVRRQEQLRAALLSGCVPPSRETVRGLRERVGGPVRAAGRPRGVGSVLSSQPSTDLHLPLHRTRWTPARPGLCPQSRVLRRGDSDLGADE